VPSTTPRFAASVLAMLAASGAAQRLNSSTPTRFGPFWTTNCGRSTVAGMLTLSTATA
jgi:hypothetical protein